MDKENALIRFHFKIDPETLSPEDWALAYKQLQWLMDNNQIPGLTRKED